MSNKSLEIQKINERISELVEINENLEKFKKMAMRDIRILKKELNDTLDELEECVSTRSSRHLIKRIESLETNIDFLRQQMSLLKGESINNDSELENIKNLNVLSSKLPSNISQIIPLKNKTPTPEIIHPASIIPSSSAIIPKMSNKSMNNIIHEYELPVNSQQIIPQQQTDLPLIIPNYQNLNSESIKIPTTKKNTPSVQAIKAIRLDEKNSVKKDNKREECGPGERWSKINKKCMPRIQCKSDEVWNPKKEICEPKNKPQHK